MPASTTFHSRTMNENASTKGARLLQYYTRCWCVYACICVCSVVCLYERIRFAQWTRITIQCTQFNIHFRRNRRVLHFGSECINANVVWSAHVYNFWFYVTPPNTHVHTFTHLRTTLNRCNHCNLYIGKGYDTHTHTHIHTLHININLQWNDDGIVLVVWCSL